MSLVGFEARRSHQAGQIGDRIVYLNCASPCVRDVAWRLMALAFAHGNGRKLQLCLLEQKAKVSPC